MSGPMPCVSEQLHWWIWSCGQCVLENLDTQHTLAVDIPGKRVWVAPHADHRGIQTLMQFSVALKVSAVWRPRTGSSEPGYRVEIWSCLFSYKVDTPFSPSSSTIPADRLCRSCDCMPGQLGPWRCHDTLNRKNPRPKKTTCWKTFLLWVMLQTQWWQHSPSCRWKGSLECC